MLAEEVGIEYGRAMAAAMGDHDGQRSFRAALHAVADALTAHGFAAHAEKEGDELRIVTEHCPFGEAAIEHPVICAVDRGMVKGMLETLYGETQRRPDVLAARGRRHLRHRRRRLTVDPFVRSYLDHASTSPLRPSARRAMADWLGLDDGPTTGRPRENRSTPAGCAAIPAASTRRA